MRTLSHRSAAARLSLAVTPLAFGFAFAAPAMATPTEGTGVAWDIVEGLTTEIGPRLAGSPAEARARDWAKARLEALGFRNVAIEPFKTDGMTRGEEHARLTAPYDQPLAITALGGSVPTPAKGLSAPLVYFPTLDALRAAPDGSLAGKVAFVDHAMRREQDGSGYGPYGDVRRKGPAIAAAKGALATVIRSAGTDSHRVPHTGATNWGKQAATPAGAVSNPDADLIARVARRGKAMAIDLTLLSRPHLAAPSGNVIGEIPGRDPSLPIILLACHLDSWDLGTGAIDNASGCAIVTAAALAATKDGPALRTIRVFWSGNEEMSSATNGGGYNYMLKHGNEAHALAMESDFGADDVWQVRTNLADKALGDRIDAALWPMGIVPHKGGANGGEDIGPIIAKQGLAVVDLGQDGTRYFDLHHTADDTLDKIDPAQLQQNVDAWTAVLRIVANEPGKIGTQPASD